MEEVFGPNECYILIRVDWDTVNKLGLELTIGQVRRAILKTKKIKLKAKVKLDLGVQLISKDVQILRGDLVKVSISDDVLANGNIWSALQRYSRELPNVIVKVDSHRGILLMLGSTDNFTCCYQ